MTPLEQELAWGEVVRDGWSWPDETVETWVARAVERTGLSEDVVVARLAHELEKRGYSVADATAMYGRKLAPGLRPG